MIFCEFDVPCYAWVRETARNKFQQDLVVHLTVWYSRNLKEELKTHPISAENASGEDARKNSPGIPSSTPGPTTPAFAQLCSICNEGESHRGGRGRQRPRSRARVVRRARAMIIVGASCHTLTPDSADHDRVMLLLREMQATQPPRHRKKSIEGARSRSLG